VKRTRVYVITKINTFERPHLYSLKDASSGKPVVGNFYRNELVVAPDPSSDNRAQLYPVERVIRQRTRKGKKEYYVKFLHYPNRYASITKINNNSLACIKNLVFFLQ